MKAINSILSLILIFISGYLLIFQIEDLMFGFMALLGSIIFFCFAALEEQKQEIERLRSKLLKSRGGFEIK